MPISISPSLLSNSIKTPSSGLASKDDAKLKQACQQFEGQFFDMMLQEMRKTVPEDPMLGDDAHQQQIFQEMMDDSTAQEMAKHGNPNDLAAQMYRQLAHINPKANAPSAAGAAAQSPAIPLVTLPVKNADNKR